jgi:hypothetical protein
LSNLLRLKGAYQSRGELEFSLLSPGENFGDDLNENSIVPRLVYGQTTFLFMGDVGMEALSLMTFVLSPFAPRAAFYFFMFPAAIPKALDLGMICFAKATSTSCLFRGTKEEQTNPPGAPILLGAFFIVN